MLPVLRCFCAFEKDCAAEGLWWTIDELEAGGDDGGKLSEAEGSGCPVDFLFPGVNCKGSGWACRRLGKVREKNR